MHLVQLLLPLSDNEGKAFPREQFDDVRDALTERFGGVTAFVQSPAEGQWKEGDERESHDELVIFEVMVDALDRDWWQAYRGELEARFRQEELVVRAIPIERV